MDVVATPQSADGAEGTALARTHPHKELRASFHLRRIPLYVCVLAFVCGVLQFSIYWGEDHDEKGEEDFPYISNTGNHWPSSAPFALGMNMLGIGLVCIAYSLRRMFKDAARQLSDADACARVLVWTKRAWWLALAGYPLVTLTGIIRIQDSRVLHGTCASLFFTVALFLTTIITYITFLLRRALGPRSAVWTDAHEANFVRKVRVSAVIWTVILSFGCLALAANVNDCSPYDIEGEDDRPAWCARLNTARALHQYTLVLSLLVFIYFTNFEMERVSVVWHGVPLIEACGDEEEETQTDAEEEAGDTQV